jgi:uncharacterized iron-regulated membrane protein
MNESHLEAEMLPIARGDRERRSGRTLFIRVHRAIGLFFGAVFVLVALSGAILSYRENIDELLHAKIMRVDVPAKAAHCLA